SVRGHAPRAAGAKMVVASDATWDTVGGGNLEATAVTRARELLTAMGPDPSSALGNTTGGSTGRGNPNPDGPNPDGLDPDAGPPTPETLTLSLTDKARTLHGQQCCGGEVTILLEPLAVVPAVAIFGVGHVGLELARILARHDIELHLVDSRAAQLDPTRLACLDDALAQVHVHHAPVPEIVLGQIPDGTHVLIMTHDHAEDAALCDMALRSTRIASIGLIGSAAKWRRFEKQLSAEGHSAEQLARITLPIGLPGITGKEPATIALSVAAALIESFPNRPSARRPASRQSSGRSGTHPS
ncbi:MAG: xanthine dehydrogenase accessory protein XdhC, partial [Dermatophilaceae bacterium]